jgi:hypothetical protein
LGRKYTIEFVKELFKKRDYVLLESTYVNTNTKLKYLCKLHPDKEMTITFKSFLVGAGCNYCAGNVKYTYKEVEEYFSRKGLLLLETSYVNNKQKLRYSCPYHEDKELSISLDGLINHSQGCPYCAGNAKPSIEDVRENFTKRGKILLDDVYINSDTDMRYICLKHPNVIQTIKYDNLIKAKMGCKSCDIERRKREGNPMWNPNKTDEERIRQRNYIEYKKWVQDVYKRDNYTCQKCNIKSSGNLNAHHLDGYDWCVEKRIDINNGVTLCESCHFRFHNQYGRGKNTKQQFEDWMIGETCEIA